MPIGVMNRRLKRIIYLCIIFAMPVMAAPKESHRVKIELKWFHQFQFAGIYLAKEKGFYDKVGLSVDIIERNINSTPVQDVLNNTVQFGITDSTIVRERLEGKPLVVLAATRFNPHGQSKHN